MFLMLAVALSTALATPPPRGEGPPPLPPELLDFAYDEDESGDLDTQEKAFRDADLSDGREAMRTPRGRPEGPPPPRPEGPPPQLERGAPPPPVVDAFDTDDDGRLNGVERQNARTEIQERIRTGRPPHPHPER
ncbi:MAG: hypothetical protein KC912_26750 [Proteobacteria bacterium]|nr:hypothetical protein [Pseudomonadota bacterium]